MVTHPEKHQEMYIHVPFQEHPRHGILTRHKSHTKKSLLEMIIARCLGTAVEIKFCRQSYPRHPRHAHILWNVSRLTESSPDIMITYIVNYLPKTEGVAGDVNKTIFFQGR